jgi:magnesium chelatase accessory protein
VARLRDRQRAEAQASAAQPVWEVDGRDWPHREASRFVPAAGLRWHVQRMGGGPVLLLVHGTGSATHSWRGLAPLLAERFTVLAPDLPGHGFTQAPPQGVFTLPGMAKALAGLLRALDARPALVVGHSAGAAILARMCLDGRITPERLVSLNGALLPFRGLAGQLFSPLAKLVASTSLAPRLFARQAADPAVVERLARDTGSSLDPVGLELYGRLARRPGHVAAALRMMAGWDLRSLARDLPCLRLPLHLLVGGNDRTIRPAEARRVRELVPTADVIRLPGLGHLAHEEQPDEVAELIVRLAQSDSFP